MRRSSAGPLRVRNEGDAPGKARTRIPNCSGRNSRLSSGSTRSSIGGGRPSLSQVAKPLGRPSMAPSTSRRNSSRSYGDRDLKKDPRPISDKHYKDRSIREVIEFLQKYSYPHPCSMKILHSPSSKEFIRIFEFIYSMIEPGFKCSSKIEEQFPQLLKALGYPFNISKSAMYAIGSPHTWPTLLAALSWLREQVEDIMMTDVEQIMFPPTHDEFDSVPMTKIVFKYCEESYHQFLSGADTFEQLEEELAKEIRKNSKKDDLEGLTHENRRLEQELLSLQNESDPLIVMKDKLASMKLDSDKIQQYIGTLQDYHSQQSTAMKTQEHEAQTLEAEIEVLTASIHKKRHILETQTFSQGDVQRINMERQSLQQQMDSLSLENERHQAACWEEERHIGQNQEAIQKKCLDYNSLMQRLQLSIPTFKESGLDFELKPSLEQVHSNHFENTIKPALTQLKNQYMDTVNELVEESIMGKANLDQLKDLLVDKQNSLAAQEKKLQNMELEFERKKNTQHVEIQRMEKTIESTETDIKKMCANRSVDLHELEQQILEEKQRAPMISRDNKKDQKKFKEFLLNIVCMIVDHLSTIQDHASKVRADSDRRLAEAEIQAEKDLEALKSSELQI